MISEKGSLDGNGSIRLLLGIHQLKHTGILYLKREDVLKVLYFNRGRLLWAISNAGEDQLETVLIRHGVVNADNLRTVKDSLPANESIGKRLVEMNILTLDDLVRYTRIQLQQIVFSVLNWQQGGYQFVKDSPPQRLLSLDLDLTELVAAFILKRIEMNRIWEEIGSFQTVLVPSDDQERLEATGLTPSQEKLLRTFDGSRDLQSVVSRYADEHQESLLKVVFYLICAGLLAMRKEALDGAGAVEEAFDTVGLLFADEKAKDEADDAQTYRFSSAAEEVTLDEDESLAGTEESNDSELDDSLFAGENRKNRRLGNWVFLLILAILITAGVILLMITRGEEAQLEKKTTIPEKTAKNVLVEPHSVRESGIDRSEPETQETPPVAAAAPKQTDPRFGDEGREAKAGDRDEKLVLMHEVKREETQPPRSVPATPKGAAGEQKTADPWSLFQAGRYQAAGRRWADRMRAEGIRYSILLELDCQVESVQEAARQFADPRDFFILNRRRGERNCFLVMWGRFRDQASADSVYQSVPEYFLKQENPPKVISLEPYLHP